jgi:hypothetical protein
MKTAIPVSTIMAPRAIMKYRLLLDVLVGDAGMGRMTEGSFSSISEISNTKE